MATVADTYALIVAILKTLDRPRMTLRQAIAFLVVLAHENTKVTRAELRATLGISDDAMTHLLESMGPGRTGRRRGHALFSWDRRARDDQTIALSHEGEVLGANLLIGAGRIIGLIRKRDDLNSTKGDKDVQQ